MNVESPAATPETPTTTTPASAEASKEGAAVLEDSAGLNAGFRKVRSEPTEDRPISPEATETAPKDAATAAPASDKKADDPASGVAQGPVVFAGLTEPQLKAALAKAGEVDELRKSLTDTRKEVLGHVGQLRQALKEAAASKTTGSGAPLKVAKDMLKRLNQDGYEELAEALAEDLSAVLQAPASAGALDLEAITKSVNEKFDARLGELNREYEKKLLTLAHKDWPTVWGSDDFKLWKGTLPAEAQKQLESSWDSVFLADQLTTFKAWKASGKTAKTDAAKEDDSTKEAKQAQEKRLAANVTPRGTKETPQARLPDAAGLSAGFNKIRKQASP
jgi:hypothetical protein